jgi:hypothetical protein
MPSGGLLVRARYSWSRRRWAVEDAMADVLVYALCLEVMNGLDMRVFHRRVAKRTTR